MLGQPISMLLPPVVGFKLHGKLPEGCTATDLVLTVTQMLRKKGVVGKFVEFYGAGLSRAQRGRSRHHRQHGSRVRRDHRLLPGGCGDARLPAHIESRCATDRTGRSLCEGAGRCSAPTPRPTRCSRTRSNSIWRPWCRRWPVPSARRIASTLPDVKKNFRDALQGRDRRRQRGSRESRRDGRDRQRRGGDRRDHELHQHLESFGDDGRGPAGEESRGARADRKPWVKTSLAPGSKVVIEYLNKAGLMPYLEALQFQSGGLRLHHLHRQQRSAARSRCATRSRRTIWWSRRC